MSAERRKMLAGELYNPLDPELVAARERARDLCQTLNATREAEQEERRLLRPLLRRLSQTLRRPERPLRGDGGAGGMTTMVCG